MIIPITSSSEIGQAFKQDVKKNNMTNEDRIGHLESKCKRLTLALSGMMVMAMAMLFIAAKPNADEDTIQARKLEIVDENGKVRIRLGSADAGYGLVVYDAQGQFRATLTDAPLGAVSQLKKDGGSIKERPGSSSGMHLHWCWRCWR